MKKAQPPEEARSTLPPCSLCRLAPVLMLLPPDSHLPLRCTLPIPRLDRSGCTPLLPHLLDLLDSEREITRWVKKTGEESKKCLKPAVLKGMVFKTFSPPQGTPRGTPLELLAVFSEEVKALMVGLLQAAFPSQLGTTPGTLAVPAHNRCFLLCLACGNKSHVQRMQKAKLRPSSCTLMGKEEEEKGRGGGGGGRKRRKEEEEHILKCILP